MKKETPDKTKGRPKSFSSPEEVLGLFEKYKHEIKTAPILRHDVRGKDVQDVNIKHEKPLLWRTFDAFLFKKGYSATTKDYRAENSKYKEFSEVFNYIRNEIEGDQLEGASVGIFNGNIVGRLIGLKDQTEVKSEVTIKETKIGFE